MEGEKKDISSVLDELERAIRTELDERPEQMEMELWPEDQRKQLRKDKEALQRRLDRIPDERKKDLELIEQRYADLVDRTFPVAVVFVIPESMLEGGLK